MPRNRSRVTELGASTQAIVPSEQTHLVRSNTNCRKHPGKTAKPRGSYLPEPKILRIQQRYIAGENKSAIAKAEGCDRETVTRIVKFPEVQQFIAQMQQEFFGLVPDAMEAVRHALKVEKNPAVAYRVLEATGVAPHQGQLLQAPTTTTPEDERQERQIRGMAACILESHRNFGVDLPPDMQRVLDLDEPDSKE
jgi:hypothetical protein